MRLTPKEQQHEILPTHDHHARAADSGAQEGQSPDSTGLLNRSPNCRVPLLHHCLGARMTESELINLGYRYERGTGPRALRLWITFHDSLKGLQPKQREEYVRLFEQGRKEGRGK